MEGINYKDLTEKLIKLGIALTSERHLDKLLEMIVGEARSFTGADGASLYVVENERLYFIISQNETLSKKGGDLFVKDIFRSFSLPIENSSLAGYVANTGLTVNLPDSYNIPPHFPFKVNHDFDMRNNYTTRSMLAVPMMDQCDDIIGVLQLINAKNKDGEFIAFSNEVEQLVLALASYAAVAYKNAMLTDEIKHTHLQTIIRLSTAAEYRDKETSFHIKRMSLYSSCLAETMGFSKDYTEMIEYASPMHDIGKLGVPDSILLKPGPLTAEERQRMERHTIMGANILSNPDSELLKLSQQIALTHHERYDGNGYPQRLKGSQIPIEGKIVALADVFDALSSKRVYKPPIPFNDVIEIIKEHKGTQFDPECVEIFLTAIPRIKKIYQEFREPM